MKMTALYERISREDRNEGESFSILRQKEYLEAYAAANGFENCRHYTDDGFSGRNFERPGWQQMMTDIDGGKIGTVLVKDMSRVGRDYLQTGFYTEIYFKEKDVRFIAIDSHVDNSRSDSLEFAPMLNVLNEMYLHDLSKKVSIGFRAKGMSGQSLASTPPFGYMRDPEDKNHWMIEPETAEVVRRIFELAATGMNLHRIAKTLQTERRITPSTYFRRLDMGNRYHLRRQETGDYDWRRSSVLNILNRREYLGMTVNFKTCTPSYKARQVQNPIEKQVVFENTHEAIVDRQAWEKAHEAFEKPKRAKAENADSNFKDFVFCARCGAPMSNLHHAQHLKTGTICYYDFFICSTYRKSEHLEERRCVQNAFSAKSLRPLLKETIQTVSRYALTNQEEFLARLQREMLAEQPEQTKQLKKGIEAKNKRVAELDRLLKKLYENYALEKIPEERFDALSAEYESEQAQLEKAVLEEQRQLDEIQSGEDKIERFMALVERYRDCTEYSDEVLRQFVEKVIVHETVKDEDGERSREIEVYLNFIGKFDVPVQPVELSPKEQKRQEALKKRRIHQRNKRAQARQEKMNAQLKNESPI